MAGGFALTGARIRQRKEVAGIQTDNDVPSVQLVTANANVTGLAPRKDDK